MDAQELDAGLVGAGYELRGLRLNGQGKLVRRVFNKSLPDPGILYLFHEDAVDLLTGKATIEEINYRNRNADVAGPWPVDWA